MSSGTSAQEFIRHEAPAEYVDPVGRQTISINIEQQGLPGDQQNNQVVPFGEADCIISRTSTEYFGQVQHAPVIDIDVPCRLEPSTTPGHFHLYIDMFMDYGLLSQLLWAMVNAGIVEQGYAEVSDHRGYSSVRLPWVTKGKETDETEAPMLLFDPYCKREPKEIQEYVMMARERYITPSRYVWLEEGTLNRDNGHFCCTECYIKIGQPSSPMGWKAP